MVTTTGVGVSPGLVALGVITEVTKMVEGGGVDAVTVLNCCEEEDGGGADDDGGA